MSGIHEIRQAYRESVFEEIFGKDWRPDRPIESLGGLLAELVQGAAINHPQTQARACKIKALIETMDKLDDVYRNKLGMKGKL